jgi:hypothetical protein
MRGTGKIISSATTSFVVGVSARIRDFRAADGCRTNFTLHLFTRVPESILYIVNVPVGSKLRPMTMPVAVRSSFFLTSRSSLVEGCRWPGGIKNSPIVPSDVLMC